MKAVTTQIKQDQLYDWGFTLDLEGQAADSLRVVDFQWQEALSGLYHGSVTLASHNPDLKLNDCIDHKVLLRIHHKYDDQTRYLAGVVESMTSHGFAGDWALYDISILPDLYRLALTSDARIFQQLSVPDIVTTILKEQGIPQHEFRLKDNHLPREYCVQYRESHLTYINRLLAEEGIFYFWEHDKAGAKLIFTDQSQFGTALLDPGLEYNNTPSGAVKGQFINALVWREAVRSTDLKQRDYCFKNPRYNQQHDLFRQREGGEPQSYQLYNAYGRYKDGDSGKRFTQYQLESVRNDASLGAGGSNAMHLSAGHRFLVTEHPSQALNREYLIVGVEHNGEQPQVMEAHAGDGGTFYQNDFECHALSATSWRPQQTTKPRMDGPQIAHVVGPKGEEIYCDEHGRVKVQFPWDLKGENNEHSSCWIRVSQGWAGAGWGGMAIPRIGQEVIVDFLEGDPDQPIITGRTYHAVNTPPYGLPANKTRMSIKSQTHKGKGFNELRFEDENGQEEVFIHAQRDQNNIVGNDETTQVGVNRTESVAKNEIIQIAENRQQTIGGYQVTQVGKDILIKSLTGDISLGTAAGNITLTEGGQVIINGTRVNVTGSEAIHLNPPGGVSPPGQTALDLKMEMPKVLGGGIGSVVAAKAGATKAMSLPRITDLMKGFSFTLSSTVAAAATGLIALVYSPGLGGESIYQIEGNEDLRIKRIDPERYGAFERRIGGEWYQTGVSAVPVLDENQQVTGFEGLSEEDARKIRLPTTYPATPPEPMPPGGFQPHDGEDDSTMGNPMPEAGMTGGPTEFPADTGVPVAGVMTSENSESTIPGRIKPRIEDGNSREGWQHIDERHVTGNSPKGPGDLFAPGTTREQIEKAADTVVTKGVRLSDQSDPIQVYEKRVKVNGNVDRVRVIVDSTDNNRVITAFPARSN